MNDSMELVSHQSSDVNLLPAQKRIPGRNSSLYQDVEKSHEKDTWSSSPKNPLNWSKRRKWIITLTACYMSSLAQIAPSAYSVGIDGMMIDLNTSRELLDLGISL
jgi:hypothetical protein